MDILEGGGDGGGRKSMANMWDVFKQLIIKTLGRSLLDGKAPCIPDRNYEGKPGRHSSDKMIDINSTNLAEVCKAYSVVGLVTVEVSAR